MADLEKIFIYMNDHQYWRRHIQNKYERCEQSARKTSRQRTPNNPDQSSWAMNQVEYLGFLLNRDGVEPQPMKIQGILDIDTPKNQRYVREFIGMVNFY